MDEEAALALRYQIMSIPTIIVMEYGLFKGRAVGVQNEEQLLALLGKCEQKI